MESRKYFHDDFGVHISSNVFLQPTLYMCYTPHKYNFEQLQSGWLKLCRHFHFEHKVCCQAKVLLFMI